MAVLAVDLIDPLGRILPELFPAEDSAALADRVSGWIAQGLADARIAALTDSDAAVTAYVYARAFGAVADRLNAQAARQSFTEQGSREILKEQLAYWVGERDRSEGELVGILAAAEEPEGGLSGAPLPSSYSAIGFVF